MATIVLSSLGSLLGPVGEMIGALAGNAIDHELFGPPDREGPRLKELAVSGSSYGTPIAAQYGSMRVPGTIIWSTDLVEHSDKQSNGKGQPKTVSFSYSVSFAVALSSRPIDRVGRIWADGNLLRGAEEDLKSAGSIRIYRGLDDQPRDPLIEAVLGNRCPAFRGCAYVVFEDLDLTDFGNRIPALSFEVFAGDASSMVESLMSASDAAAKDGTAFPELLGFSHEGGSIRNVIGLVDRIHPLTPRLDGDGLALGGESTGQVASAPLPEPAIWEEGDFGTQSGLSRSRAQVRDRSFSALRYYDPSRDYQPGMQHASDGRQEVRTYQFPGALNADKARELVTKAGARISAEKDIVSWRLAELDPSLGPGSLVTVPNMAGVWKIASWEWRERGVELQLTRHRNTAPNQGAADPGLSWKAPDRLAGTTVLRVFESPWDGIGSPADRRVYAAATSAGQRWPGAALFAVRDGALVETAQNVGQRAMIGTLATDLAASNALRFEPGAALEIDLVDPQGELPTTDMAGIAQGENRLLVGSEVIQYATARGLGQGRWRLSGLLRGRGATEIEAAAGHSQGTSVTFLDANLLALSEATLAASTGGFAAMGLADLEPALASLENSGSSLRPPCPVHPRLDVDGDGSITLRWTRRARGQWHWPEQVDLPLVEQSESYLVGLGQVDAPVMQWVSSDASISIDAASAANLRSNFPGLEFWVRQQGSFALSRPLGLGLLV